MERQTDIDPPRPALAEIPDRAAALVRHWLDARRGSAARRSLDAFTDRELQDLGLRHRDIDTSVGRSAR